MITAKRNPISTRLGPLCCAAALVCLAGCTENAPPIPDLSGTWTHPFLGLEQPDSGPGPIRNTARIPTGQSDPDHAVGDYANPILKPEAAEVLRKRGELSLASTPFPTPSDQCAPIPMPLILSLFEIQILQQPDQVIILYANHHQVRRVRMNDSHSAQVTPTWHGDSVGYYEGDTLVVDTVGVKVGPLSMVDFVGTPHSEAVHVVERYRLIDYEAAQAAFEQARKDHIEFLPEFDEMGGEAIAIDPDYKGKGLQLTFTVEDPNVFNTPWSARSTFQRSLYPFREWICAENRAEYYSDRDTPVPTADTPDF
jgi:hypothetical protein